MAVTINRDSMLARAADEAAKRMLRAAVFFVKQHQQRLSVSNPRPYLNSSREGEYPRKRTGAGIAGVVYGPDTVEGIKAAGMRLRIGQTFNSRYMLILEIAKGRLGFKKTAEDVREVVTTILGVKA